MGARSRKVTGLVVGTVLAASSAMIAVACGSFSSSGDDGVDASGQTRSDGAATTDGAAVDAAETGAVTRPGVFCGAAGSCNPQSEVCCEHLSSGGVGCLPVANRGMCQGLDLGCDDNADCAYLMGGICCGIHDSSLTTLLTSSCATLNDCKTQSFWVVVCDQTASPGTACPGGVGCHVPDGGAYGFCDGLVGN